MNDVITKINNSTDIIDDRARNDRRYRRDDDDGDGDAVQRVLRPTNLKMVRGRLR